LTCCATRKTRAALRRALLGACLGACLSMGLSACASGAAPSSRSVADLTNPAIGPDYSQWLVGALARIATPEETQGYLALTSDQAAEEFINAFWARRDPSPDRPGNALLEAYEQRAAEADRRFSEAGYLGRRTARGEIFIVYGPPQGTDFEVAPREGDPALEVWLYDKNAPAGLDGRHPSAFYRFTKRGDLTVFYVPGLNQNRLPVRPHPRDDGR
jgi:GWxTD domain-containing protein